MKERCEIVWEFESGSKINTFTHLVRIKCTKPGCIRRGRISKEVAFAEGILE